MKDDNTKKTSLVHKIITVLLVGLTSATKILILLLTVISMIAIAAGTIHYLDYFGGSSFDDWQVIGNIAAISIGGGVFIYGAIFSIASALDTIIDTALGIIDTVLIFKGKPNIFLILLNPLFKVGMFTTAAALSAFIIITAFPAIIDAMAGNDIALAIILSVLGISIGLYSLLMVSLCVLKLIFGIKDYNNYKKTLG